MQGRAGWVALGLAISCAATTVPAQAARPQDDDAQYQAAASAAWAFANRNYVAATGLTRGFDFYAIATVWDIASGLAAMFCATELGLLPRTEYDVRMARALATLGRLTLFEGIGLNKEYDVGSALPIGVARRPAQRGYGVSATDHGRLLTWLRIIANRHPQHRAAAERVVSRLRLNAFIDEGYLYGRQISRRTGRTREFQEGRIGYEQYAARGFQLWGSPAERALDIERNRKPREVYGITVPGDDRGGDRLTSEPFVLMGMETGWTAAERAIAVNLLRVQEERYKRTRRLTIVSEDAIDKAPDYFFYYTILSKHGPFTIDVQRPQARVDGPRWVSTKAAFAWHALLPNAYTRLVVDHIRGGALVRGVWGSGIFEGGRATGNANLNTAAVVLEAALYHKVGVPFHRLTASTAAAR